jgi:hypothetical protein
MEIGEEETPFPIGLPKARRAFPQIWSFSPSCDRFWNGPDGDRRQNTNKNKLITEMTAISSMSVIFDCPYPPALS